MVFFIRFIGIHQDYICCLSHLCCWYFIYNLLIYLPEKLESRLLKTLEKKGKS